MTKKERMMHRREIQRRYREKNRKKIRAASKRFYRANREAELKRRRSYNKEYYAKNREREITRAKNWSNKNPEKVKARNKRRYISATQRAAMLEGLKRWAKNNAGRYVEIKHRAQIKHRLKKYGLTLEQFEQMLVAQNYRCAICRTDKVGNKRNGKGAKARLIDPWPSTVRDGDFTWHVDHCHKSKSMKVRGLLCHPCNLALGLVKDNPEILRAMVRYLEQDRS